MSLKATTIYHQLFVYIRPFWPVLLIGITANVLYAAIDAGFTYMMRPLLDQGLIGLEQNFLRQIPLLLLIGITMRGIISALGIYCMTWVARSVVKLLRNRVFAHIIKLPADYYDEATSGQLLSKILYDVEQVAQISADTLTDLIQNTCLIIGLLLVMLIICWQFSLMFLITVPFIALIVNYTNKRVRRISHKVQQSMAEVTKIAGEAINGYQVMRIFNGEAHEIKKFNQSTEVARKNDMKVAASRALNTFGVQFIIAVGITTIILVSIQLATVIPITAGSFLSIMAAMLQLIRPMKILATLNSTIQRGLAGAESVFTLLNQKTEETQGKILIPQTLPTAKTGAIEFNNVYFAYRQGPIVLHKVSFKIAAGEIVALVGHSGSGKTTIASLLPRFYAISGGDITLDGESINNLSLHSLRAQIALVSQNVTLFNDTLANNIAYGSFNAERWQIMRAAELAFADEFISKLPNGYDSRIGDNGVLLSGGQRQRLAIARAILKNAPILILDEATSALDTKSESIIQAALQQIMQNRTTLVIAHRLSTIKQAHKIIVVNHGHIIEQGDHQQLLALNGHYTELYNSQKLSQHNNALTQSKC